MKKIVLLFLLTIIGNTIYSQKLNSFEKPDYNSIKKAIGDSKSNLHYERLFSRFLTADTTMNLEEKRHLYYGFIYNEKYSPIPKSKYLDSLNIVISKKNLDTNDFDLINRYTDNILLDSPFDLRTMNIKLFVLKKGSKEKEFKECLFRAKTIIDAILSSGNGIEKNSSYYVIQVSHEYDILNVLGFTYGGKQSLIENYDYLTIANNKYNVKGLYFDISPSLNYLEKMLK